MRTLLQDVDDFLEAYPQVYPAQIGKQALKDGTFVAQLRDGRKVRPSTEQKVRAWMLEFAAAEAAKAEGRAAARERIEGMTTAEVSPASGE